MTQALVIIGSFQEIQVCITCIRERLYLHNYVVFSGCGYKGACPVMMLVFIIEKTKSSGQSGVKQKDTPSGEQKKRVDGLLAELIKAFPPKVFQSKVY